MAKCIHEREEDDCHADHQVRHVFRDRRRIEVESARCAEHEENRHSAKKCSDYKLHVPLLTRLRCGIRKSRRLYSDWTERLLLAQAVHGQAQKHCDARGAHAYVPVDLFAEIARYHLADQRADVDSHVEDREARVSSSATLRIEITDDRRDVRLEQTRSEHDQYEAEEERNLPG
jgi:hypothetical protein